MNEAGTDIQKNKFLTYNFIKFIYHTEVEIFCKRNLFFRLKFVEFCYWNWVLFEFLSWYIYIQIIGYMQSNSIFLFHCLSYCNTPYECVYSEKGVSRSHPYSLARQFEVDTFCIVLCKLHNNWANFSILFSVFWNE